MFASHSGSHPETFMLISGIHILILLALCCSRTVVAEDWPQNAGPHGNWSTSDNAPVSWSVVNDRNIVVENRTTGRWAKLGNRLARQVLSDLSCGVKFDGGSKDQYRHCRLLSGRFHWQGPLENSSSWASCSWHGRYLQ